MSFKKEHSLEKRTNEAKKIRERYPDRIPIIVEKDLKSDVPDIDKKKFLVPDNLTMCQFQYVIRKRIKVNPEKSIFIFVNGKLVPSSSLLSTVFEEHADEDGFLYMVYNGENTFG
jgi:GABA(A) receptor-associated protein